MHRRGYAKTIGLAVVVVVFIAFVWYAAFTPTIGYPVESRRYVHPSGFSVVQPLDWEKHVSFAINRRTSDSVKFLPAKSVGSPGYFMATRLEDTLNEKNLLDRGYKPATFEGKPAYEKWGEVHQTHEHTRSLVFFRDGGWYDLSLRRPETESIDDGIWLKYLQSFKAEPRHASTQVGIDHDLIDAATQPTTAPAP